VEVPYGHQGVGGEWEWTGPWSHNKATADAARELVGAWWLCRGLVAALDICSASPGRFKIDRLAVFTARDADGPSSLANIK
jgi:hypothetical protein